MNTMYLAENLRRLRAQKGFTQEKLAEMLGVSAQAVSRWECGAAHPDVTLLPGLAILFDVSVDSLLGMETLRKQNNLHDIFSLIHQKETQGMADEAIEILRKAIKLYPDNNALRAELALALTQKNDHFSASLDEAISLSEKVLSESTNAKLRATTAANLCYLYLQAGEQEKSISLARTLPHIWESREMVLPELYDRIEYHKKLEETILSILAVIDEKIKRAAEQHSPAVNPMIALGAPASSSKEAKDRINRLLRFLNIDG